MRNLLSGILLLACLGVTAAAQATATPTPAKAKTEAEQTELRGQAIAMLGQTARQLREMRVTENRVNWQIQLAGLLWPHDATQARATWDHAAAGWKEALSQAIASEARAPNFHNLYNLRQNLTRTLARYDGPAALQFVRSTRELILPYMPENYGPEQEINLETEIAALLARTDSQAALKIAQDTLAQGVTGAHVNVFSQLRASDPAAAQGLGRQIYERVREADLLQSGAGFAGYMLAHQAQNDLRAGQQPNRPAPLLTEAEARGLTERLVNAALSVTPDRAAPGYYSPEYQAARNLSNMLSNWQELDKYLPGRRAELQARSSALVRGSTSGPPNVWQEYQTAIQQQPLSAALDKIAAAPPQMRDGLYQQVAWKAAQTGDLDQARSIINTHLRNPQTRAQTLRQAEQQAFASLVNKGQITEARVLLASVRAGQERAMMLLQLADKLVQQDKKDEALQLLDEARDQLPPRPSEQNQLPLYFRLLQSYQLLDSSRAFALLEPWLEQFNEMAAAAEKLDGFAGDFYRDDEFLPQGHPLASYTTHFAQALSGLAQSDFDRTQKQLDKFQRPEVRIIIALAIGRRILEGVGSRPAGLPLRQPGARPVPRRP